VEKSWIKLELNKILDMCKEKCFTPMGRERVEQLLPVRDREKVKRRLQATSEGAELLRLYPQIPWGPVHDLRIALRQALGGGIWSPEELWQLASTLSSIHRIRAFFQQIERDKAYPLLHSLAQGLTPLADLEREIYRCIGPGGEVLDSASPRLASLRREIQRVQGEVKGRLESFLRSPEIQKYLQDNLYTLRHDRYVLPVKQEYRHKVPGLVHDQSASGATLFIEPLALVELNNELRRLAAAEAREIEAILEGLTRKVAQKGAIILKNLEILGELDFILAKARLSREMEGQEPFLNEEGRWRLLRARHPLLGKEAVPIDLTLGEDFHTLVITGPNTGGKTVTLKTVGLLTLMAQCGFHLPAASGTEIDPTAEVFADIGDEQSIEQSLSTFSSHMSHIVNIIQRATPKSLVLLDELGAGTDPAEGAALAMAILDHFTRLGARTIATTHYSELKAYAYTAPGVENAAMEFDSRTLRPTFRLLVGTPGESNAFIIASRLGLPPDIVEKAQEYMGEKEKRASLLIAGLAEDKRLSQREREEAERLKRETEKLQQQLLELKEEWQEKVKKEAEKFKREFRQLLQRARAQIREVLARVERALAEESLQNQRRALYAAQRELKELEVEMEGRLEAYRLPQGEKVLPPGRVKPGDRVRLRGWGQVGEVVSCGPGEKEAQVQVGYLKVSVPLGELELLEQGNGEGKGIYRGWHLEVAPKDIRPEIDLRGLTVEEACHRVEGYLDDALLSGFTQVYLIHGKGTGALRRALQEYLKAHPLVKDFRLGGPQEGGSGVTVVELKR